MAARLSDTEARLVIAALTDSIDKTDQAALSPHGHALLKSSAADKANQMRKLRSRLTANLEGRGAL